MSFFSGLKTLIDDYPNERWRVFRYMLENEQDWCDNVAFCATQLVQIYERIRHTFPAIDPESGWQAQGYVVYYNYIFTKFVSIQELVPFWS